MGDEITDTELLAAMAAKPDGERKVSVQPSASTRKLSAADAKKKVWIKCVVDTNPWTSDEGLGGLESWKEYEIRQDEALLMQDRNQVVVIAGPTKENI